MATWDDTEYTFNVWIGERLQQHCKEHPLANDLVTLEIDDNGYAYMACQADGPETAHMIKEMT